ncbi:MAG TPA: response regulator [Polyangiales bacterium]
MKRVLLLDADVGHRRLLRSALVARGLEVIEADRAQDAELALREHAVDLVIVDTLLPDGRGLDFIEQLRSRDRDTRVVFLSDSHRHLQAFRRLSQELDVSLVAYKPVDPTKLAARVVELGSARVGGARPSKPAEHASASVLSQEFAELRRGYASRLPDKLAELERALAAAKHDAVSLAEARALAHRLRGSAGTYGFAGVGDAAGLVEDLLAEPVLASAGPRRLFWQDIDGAMSDARAAAARAPLHIERGVDAQSAPVKALLLVDDDPDFLRLVQSAARKLLVEVLTTRSADEALRLAQTRPLLAAILDVHLSEDDSFVLARKIRETKGNSEIPIAFASADRRIETRVAAVEAGGTKFFEKPISEESFGELVHQFLQLSQAGQGRVLIVDDDSDVREQYARHLRNAGLLVEELASADKLVERLEESRPDVLLLDINLPRVSGIDVCRALRMSGPWELLPILLVSAQTDSDTRLHAFRAGASDVLAKPVLPEELLARVGVQLERIRLLRDRADKDPLSGLWLRRAFLEAFQRALASCAREKKPLSLVIIDLDHFKRINDQHGHLAGDQVIARVGELLRQRFRIEDLRARWGGEEFVLVFPGHGVGFAAQAARRLLHDVSQLRFTADDKQLFSVTFSAGVAGYPEDGSSMTALIRRADELLYAGKNAGRNRVTSGLSSAAEALETLVVGTQKETR